MKFLTRKYLAPLMKLAVSAISSSEAIEGPSIWNTANVIWPVLAASRNPISRRQATAGADVDHGHRRAGCVQRIEDLHLIRGRRHVDDLGDIRVEAFEGAARRLGIEGTGWNVIGA